MITETGKFKEVPQNIWDMLEYAIAREELEYADNWRAYRLRGSLLLDEFLEAREQGCCGSFEVAVTDTNGDRWVVGCNYGH